MLSETEQDGNAGSASWPPCSWLGDVRLNRTSQGLRCNVAIYSNSYNLNMLRSQRGYADAKWAINYYSITPAVLLATSVTRSALGHRPRKELELKPARKLNPSNCKAPYRTTGRYYMRQTRTALPPGHVTAPPTCMYHVESYTSITPEQHCLHRRRCCCNLTSSPTKYTVTLLVCPQEANGSYFI